MLDAVDRKTKRGKRDYAILLLGVVTGLRAVDIVNLELGDIDWIRGEIKLVQAKIRKTVVLPLTADVGEAIKDYILNVRPAADTQKIFLRIQTPYRSFASAVSIGEIFNDWRKAAGLTPSKPYCSDSVYRHTPNLNKSRVRPVWKPNAMQAAFIRPHR